MNHANEESNKENGNHQQETTMTTTTRSSNVKPFDQLTINGDILDYPQFYATRDIEPYEELLWDYGEYFFLEK